ncbi:hypothetical protein MAR_005379 [Mya arenaria]|uniref:SGNH hydrolase-type esterase domain-containing protein n=1 Tax=Mya arenaria TaxID=6604 RepID=A0ABY7F3C0_MYAAR|nr:hypothetical protein MAR_005379 [Mya arenaria]
MRPNKKNTKLMSNGGPMFLDAYDTIQVYTDPPNKGAIDLKSERNMVPMEVRFFGAGGMKASKPKPGLLKQVKMYGADLVVVSLGGNDITTTSVPKDIVAAVLDIAQDFLDSGVSTILVLEIGERGAFRDGLGYRSFASQRARINQLLGRERELVEVLRLPTYVFQPSSCETKYI